MPEGEMATDSPSAAEGRPQSPGDEEVSRSKRQRHEAMVAVSPDAPEAEFARWAAAALEVTGSLASLRHAAPALAQAVPEAVALVAPEAQESPAALVPAPAMAPAPVPATQPSVDVFADYKFTGPIRPARVTPQMKPPSSCSKLPDYALHPKGFARSEFLKSNRRNIPVFQGAELETMREACRLGREVLDIASRFLRVGVTGDEIDRIVWQACRDRGLYPSPLNYFGFPKSVCVSANEVLCHGIPDCRALEEGDIVNLDISVCHQGFHSDLNETFFVGQCDEDSQRVVRTAYDALRAAAAEIRPGTMYRDLGGKIQDLAERNGCKVANSYCGHGVGKLFHGPPDIPHYRKNKAIGVMKPGHVFTVEPILSLGTSGKDQTWPDGWTAVSRNGLRSAQFEHTFLVTEDGVELLTARPGTDPVAMPDFDAKAFQR